MLNTLATKQKLQFGKDVTMKLRASQLKIILARLSWVRGHTASNIFFFTSFMKVCNFDLLILNWAKELKRLKTN